MPKKRLGINPLSHLISSRPSQADASGSPSPRTQSTPPESTESPVASDTDEPVPDEGETVLAPQVHSKGQEEGGAKSQPSLTTKSVNDFVRKTVHLRAEHIRKMKQVAALEEKSIKDVYDEALRAYLDSKRPLLDRHNL